MPTKKIKRKSKRKYSRKGDHVHHGSSYNRISIRIVPQQQTSSTPPIHPDTFTLAEQTRLHHSAVQAIVLDNHKPPTGTMMPVRVPVRTSLTPSPLARRGQVDNPFARPASVIPEMRRSVSPEIQPASPIQEISPSPTASPASSAHSDILQRVARETSVDRIFPDAPRQAPVQRFYHPFRRQTIKHGTERYNQLLSKGAPLKPASPTERYKKTYGYNPDEFMGATQDL